jgi:hypothetical protein
MEKHAWHLRSGFSVPSRLHRSTVPSDVAITMMLFCTTICEGVRNPRQTIIRAPQAKPRPQLGNMYTYRSHSSCILRQNRKSAVSACYASIIVLTYLIDLAVAPLKAPFPPAVVQSTLRNENMLEAASRCQIRVPSLCETPMQRNSGPAGAPHLRAPGGPPSRPSPHRACVRRTTCPLICVPGVENVHGCTNEHHYRQTVRPKNASFLLIMWAYFWNQTL